MNKKKIIMLLGVIFFIVAFWSFILGIYIRGNSKANDIPREVTLDVTGEDPTEKIPYENYISMYKDEFNDLKRKAVNGQAVKTEVEGTVYTIESNSNGKYNVAIKTKDNISLFINLSEQYSEQVLALKEGQKLNFIGYLKIQVPLINLGDREYAGVKYPHYLYLIGEAVKEKSKQELALGRKALLLLENQRGIGSGVVINNDGYFLTTYDNVKRYEDKTVAKMYVYGDNSKEQLSAEIPARMIAFDENKNIALMKLEGTQKNYDFLKLGTRYKETERVTSIRNRERVKDIVYVIGEGRLSKINTLNDVKYLVTSETMFEAGRGGIVLNSYGELVGLSSFRWVDEYNKAEMNFAISAESIMEFIDSIALKNNIKIEKNDKDIFSKSFEEAETKPTDFN